MYIIPSNSVPPLVCLTFRKRASVLPVKNPENKEMKTIEKADFVPSLFYEGELQSHRHDYAVGKSAPTSFHIFPCRFRPVADLELLV
jgi:hypothetical protein